MTFAGLPAGSTITIAGLTARAGVPVPLPPGLHPYTVHAPGWCPASGVVELASGAKQEVKLVEKDWRLPRVRFKVNKHKIQILVAGLTTRGGQWVTLPGRCSGVVSYKAWLYKQVQTGEITLRPGATVEISVELLDPDSVRALVRRARTQRRGQRLSADFNLGVPTGAHQDLALLYLAGARYHWSFDFLRLGGGLQLGFGNGFAIEAFGSALLQMTDLGNQRPLHIQGLVTLVPFVGVELGLGYQSIHDIAGTPRRNFRVDPKDTIWTNIGVLRVLGGVTVPFSDVLAAEARVSWNANMAGLLQLGLGLSARFM